MSIFLLLFWSGLVASLQFRVGKLECFADVRWSQGCRKDSTSNQSRSICACKSLLTPRTRNETIEIGWRGHTLTISFFLTLAWLGEESEHMQTSA